MGAQMGLEGPNKGGQMMRLPWWGACIGANMRRKGKVHPSAKQATIAQLCPGGG